MISFTHDVDFFSGTMPDPIHKSGGFSDFTPMTSMDTALIPQSQADNARREYVWIFQFEKGTFDPSSFSQSDAINIQKWKRVRWGRKRASRQSGMLSGSSPAQATDRNR